jgi:hypothetical protein
MHNKKTIEIKCPICDKSAFKYQSEVKRQLKAGRKIYCSRQCSILGIKNSNIKYPKYKKICSMCGQKFLTSDAKKSPKYCSIICATNYSRQFVDKSKISSSMKAAWRRGDFNKFRSNVEKSKISASMKAAWGGGAFGKFESKLKINGMYNLKCVTCNENFLNRHKNIKTCGKKCYLKLLSKQSRENPNCGGETNYKKYIYKNVCMDSSWEVKLAKFLDLNNIIWERSKKLVFLWTDIDNKKRRYHPDFYLPEYNLYLDPKNKFLMKKDQFKINQVLKENNINLIFGSLDEIRQQLQNKILKGL